MGVSDPVDVLRELIVIHDSYRGPIPWRNLLSNPVKDRPSIRKYPLAPHSEPRNDLSGRSGSALLYALRYQAAPLRPSQAFGGRFADRGGRLLLLENGVIRDLLGIGAIALQGTPHSDELILTGLGVEKLRAYFPNHGLRP